jgi:predicted amidophosphoribosyltransferase
LREAGFGGPISDTGIGPFVFEKGRRMTPTCPRCGRENTTQSSFCEGCLQEFPSELWDARRLICPECRHDNPHANDHCERCHEPLKPGQSE